LDNKKVRRGCLKRVFKKEWGVTPGIGNEFWLGVWRMRRNSVTRYTPIKLGLCRKKGLFA